MEKFHCPIYGVRLSGFTRNALVPVGRLAAKLGLSGGNLAIPAAKLGKLIEALKALGDLPPGFAAERLFLAGITQVGN